MTDYRAELRTKGAETFQEILEEAWMWDEEAGQSASYPAWPYVGEEYGESPRILIVGKAHQQWPSTTVGGEDRRYTHLHRVGSEDGFSEFKGRYDPDNMEEILDDLTWFNDVFIDEVKAGFDDKSEEIGYPTAFWRFTKDLLREMGSDFDSYAWTNTYPFCRSPEGMPGDDSKQSQKSFRTFVRETAEAIEAEYVAVMGSHWNWQSEAEAALPFDWETRKAPIPGWKSGTWTRTSLPWGGMALRSWHPQGVAKRPSFAKAVASEFTAGMDE